MSNRRIFSLVLSIQCIWLLHGCITHEIEEIPFEWESMTASNFDNQGKYHVVTTADRIPAAAYGINLDLTSRPVTARIDGFRGTAVAYATTSPDAIHAAIDSVQGFEIMMESDRSAAVDVTRDFVWSPDLPSQLRFVDDFFAIETITRMLSLNRYDRVDLYLVRNLDRARAGNARFTITIRLASGKTLIATTPPVTLY